MSWDLAFTGKVTSDFVVGQVWATDGANRYLIHQVRKRMTFSESVQAILDTKKQYPQAQRILVEAAANGHAAMDILKKELTGLIPVPAKGSKEARAHAVSAAVESGNVLLPGNAPWLRDFLDELGSFPNGTHDDQVDSLTQALGY